MSHKRSLSLLLSFALIMLVAGAIFFRVGATNEVKAAQVSSIHSAAGPHFSINPGSDSATVEPAFYKGAITYYEAYASSYLLAHQPPASAQTLFYEVVYPTGWQALGLPAPICNPCDHDQNGIDATDYHDHILGAVPSVAGYTPWWHLHIVSPAYTGEAKHDAVVTNAYAQFIPTTSVEAVQKLLKARLADGSPVASIQDTHFAFFAPIVLAGTAR